MGIGDYLNFKALYACTVYSYKWFYPFQIIFFLDLEGDRYLETRHFLTA